MLLDHRGEENKLLLPRRRFFKAVGMSIATFALGGCGSSLFEEELGKSTEPLNQTLEQTLFNQYKLSNFPRQSIDPKALIVNTAEEETPEIAEDSFRLIIDGMVDHPLSLTLHELKGLPYASMIIRHVCVEGWAAIVQWGGVQLSHLANLARARNSVRYVYFASAGKLYYETWDIASAMHPQTILAYQKNFEPLPKDNGGPLRLASPVKLGYKQSKWVTQVSFLSSLPEKRGYWEDQGYEWYAGL